MTMVYQSPGSLAVEVQILADIMCECHATVSPAEEDNCATLGEKKHQCCEDKIQAQKSSSSPANIDGERGYNGKGGPISAARGSFSPAPPKDSMWPDACTTDGAGNPTQFLDFKFVCPKGGRYYDKATGTVGYASGNGTPGASFYLKGGRNSQFNKYKRLGKKLNPPVTKDPMPLESSACR
jgi:hypothetical protein